VEREKVRFGECVAWYYRGVTGACVIMAGGSAVPKEPGTDRFARRFVEAGFGVLAFDYRHFGESGGWPRQVVRIREQLADWDAAIAFAPTLPGVDPARLAIWGFSLSGGHVLPVAARHPRLAAAIAQSPLVDGPAAGRAAARYQKPIALLRLAVSRRLVPLAAAPGTVALLTTPDAQDGDRALNPGNRYPEWRQEIAAGSALRIGLYRPARYASRVRCPLLVLVCDDDRSALAEPAVRVAARAPRAELFRLPGGHYEPFLDGHERAVAAELAFLRRHLLAAPDLQGRSMSA
jgi:uncharacterized protein